MKGKWLTGVLVLAMAAVTLAGCGAKDETKEKVEQVTLNEVAHSIFYAPQYVAIEEGYFADEGIDLTLITGFGADKVLTAMISGDADIGFMGAEATVYAYLEGTADPVVNFAQLTQRAGNFVVGREKDNSFTWEKLKNKEVLGGRKGGMPEMVFEYVLAQKGIDKKDVNINQSIDFGSTAAAFSGGQGDYTIEFEPSATLLEQKGDGSKSLPLASSFPLRDLEKPRNRSDKMTPEFPRAPRKSADAVISAALVKESGLRFFKSCAAAASVMLIFVPVSPSGTGKTFSSLIFCFFSSIAALADTIIRPKAAPSMECLKVNYTSGCARALSQS